MAEKPVHAWDDAEIVHEKVARTHAHTKGSGFQFGGLHLNEHFRLRLG